MTPLPLPPFFTTILLLSPYVSPYPSLSPPSPPMPSPSLIMYLVCLYTSWRLSILAATTVGPITLIYRDYATWSKKINKDVCPPTPLYSSLARPLSPLISALPLSLLLSLFLTNDRSMQAWPTQTWWLLKPSRISGKSVRENRCVCCVSVLRASRYP